MATRDSSELPALEKNVQMTSFDYWFGVKFNTFSCIYYSLARVIYFCNTKLDFFFTIKNISFDNHLGNYMSICVCYDNRWVYAKNPGKNHLYLYMLSEYGEINFFLVIYKFNLIIRSSQTLSNVNEYKFIFKNCYFLQ